MATTNLIVDFLVIGISSLVWILPILRLFCLTEQIKDFFTANPLNLALALPLLVLLYVIGIAINRISDYITKKWNDKIEKKVFPKNKVADYHQRLNAVVARSETASDYLNYRRGIVRISRASCLNIALGLLAWILNVFWNRQIFGSKTIIFLIIAALALLLPTLYWTWVVTLRGYFSAVKNFYESTEAKGVE